MTRRKDGLWQETMTVTVNGRKKVKYFYGKTKAEVYRKIADYEEQEEKGTTFGFVADLWFEEAESAVEPTTYKSYRAPYNRAVEAFGDVPIKDIRPADITRYISAFARSADASRSTAANQLIIFSQVFKYAVDNGYADINAARDVALPKGLKKSNRDVPTDEDIQAVKRNVDHPFGLLPYMAMYTGCRLGELLALTWNDIDFDNRVIHINKSVYHLSNAPEVKSPKTLSGYRTIPLLDKLYDVLPKDKKSGAVFSKGSGNYISAKYLRYNYNKYRSETGVKCTMQQLRHCYATMLFENGVEPKDAQRLLGHAQLSTTLEIYTHLRQSRIEKINQNLLHLDIK